MNFRKIHFKFAKSIENIFGISGLRKFYLKLTHDKTMFDIAIVNQILKIEGATDT